MSVKIEPISVIRAQVGINPNGPVQSFFTNTCYKTMNKYVPKDIGNLRNIVVLTKNTITYDSPYAYYQYKGMREDGSHVINPVNYTTAGTGPYWDKKMWSAEGDKVIRQVQNYINWRTK